MSNTKRVAKATYCENDKENNEPRNNTSESSPLNQRVIIQNSMVENMGNSSIKNNNITLASQDLAKRGQNPIVRSNSNAQPYASGGTDATTFSYAEAVVSGTRFANIRRPLRMSSTALVSNPSQVNKYYCTNVKIAAPKICPSS